MAEISIKYKGSAIAEMSADGTKTLNTSGKYCEGDVVVTYDRPTAKDVVSGSKAITSNGTHDVTEYASVAVSVGAPDGYIVPSGTKDITTNGTHDVASYLNAKVNVPVPDGYVKPSGSVDITQNGTHDVSKYASAKVNVPIPDGYIVPSGTLEVTENGTHDVKNYESVTVNVESGSSGSSDGNTIRSGTFVAESTTQVFTIDVGVDASKYNYLVLARLDTLYATKISVASRLVGVAIYNFDLGTMVGSQTSSSSEANFGGGFANDNINGYGTITRSGTTIAFNGYSYSAKLEVGKTYRWMVW